MAAETRRTPPKLPRPQPAPVVDSPIIAALEEQLRLDPDRSQAIVADFWSVTAANSPIIESADQPGEAIVTFVWQSADATDVVLFVNRLTDERELDRSKMHRVAGTDIWHLSYQMPTDWRASYAAIVQQNGAAAPWVIDDQISIRRALDGGQPDPRNPVTCRNRAGFVQSVVELSDSPPQPWLEPTSANPGEVNEILGPSAERLWEYIPATVTLEMPLLIVFDGDVWTGPQNLAATLDNLIDAGKIPPLLAVLIDAGDRTNRWRQLGEGTTVLEYLAEQLVPWIRSQRPVATHPEQTVAIGQSLGALSALRLVAHAPQVVGGVISQSASIWQDEVFDEIGSLQELPARLYIEVGKQEWILQPDHPRLVQALRDKGAVVEYAEFNGGHDYACWRGGIADGLQWYFSSRENGA